MQLTKYLPLFLLAGLLACQKPTDAVNPGGPDNSPPSSTSSVSGTPTAVGQPMGGPITKTIGPAGGVITTADGRVQVTFPAGAIQKETVITVQPVENTAIGGTGQGYQLTPTDLKLAKDAQISWQYTPDDVDGSAPEALGIAYQDQAGVWQSRDNLTVNKATQTATAPINQLAHWSFYEQFHLRLTKKDGTGLGRNSIAPSEGLKLEAFYQPNSKDGLPDLVPLGTEQIMQASRVVRWTINGITDGVDQAGDYSHIGQIAEDKTYARATYDAPPREPDTNPVIIGVELDLKQFGHVTLTQTVRIESPAYLKTGDTNDTNPIVGLTVRGTELTGLISNQNGENSVVFVIKNFQGKGTYRIDKEHSVLITLIERGEGASVDSYWKGTDWISGGGTVVITEYNGTSKPIGGQVSGSFFLQKTPTLLITTPASAKFRVVPAVVPQ